MKKLHLIIVALVTVNMGLAQWQRTTETIQHPKVDNFSNEDLENHKKQKVMIDWSKGWVEFEGIAYVDEQMAGNWGKAMTRAERLARTLAIADMADFVLDLMVMGGTEYVQEELDRDNFTVLIKGTIDARHKVLFKDKGLTEITIPGRGREPYAWGKYVIGLQMYEDKPGEGILNSIVNAEKSGYKKDGYSVYKPVEEKPVPEKYTGLIVDARGLDIMSSMSPSIFVDGVNKQQLYGALTVMTSAAQKFGIVSYLTNMEEAKTCDRVAKEGTANPLVVKATGLGGRNSQSVYVSKEDANKVFNANADSRFLDECRVVFLVD